MLLEFTTQNYKSFVEETRFSMRKAPKQKGLDYSLLKERVKGKTIEGLCTSVIYGPNAAGKTNIIGAMDVFRAIVLRGNIRNAEEKLSPNPAAAALELIPNNALTRPEPVTFSVEFFEEDLLVAYRIQLDLGKFLDADYERKIIEEGLDINGETIFIRNDKLKVQNLKLLKKYLPETAEQNFDSAFQIAQNSLNPEELFLTNGFKLIFSPSFVKMVTDWFAGKFMIICRADSIQLIKRFADPQKRTAYVERTTDKAAKLFGINSNAVGYIVNEEDSEVKLCSIFENVKEKKNIAMAAEIFESYGTIRFINMFPLVIRAIQTGGILVVDEFDASIHPMALMSIINVFHNDDINIHHAQLIFNTHNPIFLNSNLFRRDEIKFVERDDNSHYSTLYALSDFGTTGDKGVRRHEDYMKNYFISQYGAIKDIDFTPIFEEILASESEVQ
ncbi:MAG: ATP-binding protein [Lachnospiraceae bacterium]|nr:ATP-binding protein [Lachnospiraceae bacterium]